MISTHIGGTLGAASKSSCAKTKSNCLLPRRRFSQVVEEKPSSCKSRTDLLIRFGVPGKRRGILCSGDMTLESRREFRNSKGERLVGLLMKGEGTNTDVTLLCHGYTSNKNSCRFGEIAQGLAHAGMSSFRFDHPCAVGGDSTRLGEFRMGNHADEVDDIRCAAEFLRGEGYRVVCLLGHSKGGTNILKYCSDHGDIPRAINLAGRFQPINGLDQRFGASILEKLKQNGPIERKERWGTWTMRYEDFQERATLPMEEFAVSIRDAGKVNLVCIHGRDDATISYEESERCAGILGRDCIVIEGGDHNFTSDSAASDMIRHVVTFATSGMD